MILICCQCLGLFFFYFCADSLCQTILRFQLVPELLRVQTVIVATEFEQFRMGALFGDASIFGLY